MAKLACVVTPAQAGVHRRPAPTCIPAFAGMTRRIPALAEMNEVGETDF
jgi:hypothetical protein